MPQFLPWAQPLLDFTVYEPYIVMELTLCWCPSVQLTKFHITFLKCQPPASEQVSQLLEVFLAISVFFFRKFPSIFAKDTYSCTLSLTRLISWIVFHLLEPNDKNLVSRITRALWRFATPTLKPVKLLNELQRQFWNTNISYFRFLSLVSMQTIPHSIKQVFVFRFRSAINLSFENIPLF